MKIDVTAVLKNIKGESLKDGDKDVTLRDVSVSALTALYNDEPGVTGDEKFGRYKLALRLSEHDTLELTPEDAAKVKQLIGKAFGPVVVGPAYELLNG